MSDNVIVAMAWIIGAIFAVIGWWATSAAIAPF